MTNDLTGIVVVVTILETRVACGDRIRDSGAEVDRDTIVLL